MIPSIKPALDPLAQREAIEALEAQRAAYQRYARTVDDQTRAVRNGDADTAVAAANTTARGFDELDAGAQALRPHLARVREQGSPDQQADVQRHLDALSSDADRAQTAIQNLTSQLDAWRLAYGRQLAAVGLTPGGSGGAPGTGATAIGGASGAAAVSARGGTTSGTRTPDSDSTTSGVAARRTHDSGSYGPRGQTARGGPAPTLLNRVG